MQNKYKYFPKLFYIKFSNTHGHHNSNSKLLTHKYKRGITFGTFDLFHFGHDNILKRCMQFCEYLCIGLSSDELNVKKGKNSVDNYEKRKEVIEEAKLGDEIFKEESLEYKDDYVLQTGSEILMMGDDWVGKFDWVSCDVLYMERTPNISTSMLKEKIIYK
jgi:glycerol-3-phosphate cytidylyltransferase